jgi:hypothetical protein
LYALKFIGVSNCSRVAGNRSKIQHRYVGREGGEMPVYELTLVTSLHLKNRHDEENEVHNQYLYTAL